jgi:Bacterial SH3 domain
VKQWNLRLTSLVISATATACIATWVFAETLYVQVGTAQIRSGKTSLDPVTGQVRFGEALNVLQREDKYIQVKTRDGVQGWIYSAKLATTPPVVEGDDNLFAKAGKVVRGQAGQTTATGGARGLDKIAEGYAQQNNISPQSREAVDRMTNYQLGDKQIDEFMKKGGLGEYAK